MNLRLPAQFLGTIGLGLCAFDLGTSPHGLVVDLPETSTARAPHSCQGNRPPFMQAAFDFRWRYPQNPFMKTRLILSLLAGALLVLSALFFIPSQHSPLSIQLVNARPVPAQLAVVPLPPVPVAVSPVPEISEVAPIPDAKPEVFKCKENGHITYSATPCADCAVVAAYDAKRTTFTETSSLDSISIARNSAGHYVARGVADGQALDFTIDTGATVVALPGEFARGRRIVCEGVSVARTPGGDARMCLVTLKRLNLAGMDFYNVPAHIVPTLKGEGLFGQELLNRLKVTQGGGFMTLSR